MPGYIKESGVQRPIAAPYVKDQGAWKPAVLGYIKDQGTWKIWHASDIEDTFDRANSGTLGVASNGFTQWTTRRETWGIVSNQASSSAAGSDYALATAPLYKAGTDYVVSVDIPSGNGTGIAVWVEDEDNWWAVYPTTDQVSNPGYYYCPSGGTLSGTTCTPSGYNYAATYYPATPGSSYYYCSGGSTYSSSDCSLSGSTCTCTQTAYTTTNWDYVGCRTPSGCSSLGGNRQCVDSSACYSNPTTGTYYCACFVYRDYCVCFGQDYGPPPCSGSCTLTKAASIQTTSPTPAYYGCPQGGSLISATTCFVQPPSYTASYQPPYTTYPKYIRTVRAVAGVVTAVKNVSLSSEARSLKVSTVRNEIRASAYSAANLGGNLINSSTYVAGEVTKTTTIGIIKGPSDQGQASAVDNFKAE